MDEKQLHYEFMSILSESHPGLTFEEYRDSCVFLLFYQFLCLKSADRLNKEYKSEELVKIAIRGKLQIPSFLSFMESASSFLHLYNKDIQLTDFLFYKKLKEVHSIEKQKSFARFFRKFIKKIDGWGNEELLFQMYPELFSGLIREFAGMKKDTFIPDELYEVYHMFFELSGSERDRVFLPDFQYGLLADTMTDREKVPEIYGYETEQAYIDIFTALCYMNKIPLDFLHLYLKKDWEKKQDSVRGFFDRIAIYMPDGAEAGEFVISPEQMNEQKEFLFSGAKGEFPFLLSALACLRQKGSLGIVFPGALLYREGRESQIRKFLVDDLNCLDSVMLLPDHIFHSGGQTEIFLFFRLNREDEGIMFFDCSEMERIGQEQREDIKTIWKERKTVPGFCACVSRERVKENDYNLNIPRYITKIVEEKAIDMEKSRKRIAEIDRELEEIEEKISMYRRDLGL
ncbi:MAG: N-6 DNA methylase [Lachnospiraceae bacterium]|nr:N-6 DNA methylase [Lachnospiraceae bacterium]